LLLAIISVKIEAETRKKRSKEVNPLALQYATNKKEKREGTFRELKEQTMPDFTISTQTGEV